jgi:tyrosine-specific transport protein
MGMEAVQQVSRHGVWSAALLIAGTAIGAGMLALPVLTAQAGLFPTLILFSLCGLLMGYTGLLYVDACERVGGAPNILSLAGTILGRRGRLATWLVYLGLFYALLVAYQSAAGDIFSTMTGGSPWLGRLLLAGSALLVVNLGTGTVQKINNLLMAGLVVTYLLFIGMGLPHVQSAPLLSMEWPAALIAMPVALTAFGYQGVIPSLAAQLQGRLHLLRRAIFIGVGMVLLVYALWELVVLSIVPQQALTQALSLGQSAISPLQAALKAPWLLQAGQFFGLFALVTSFLGVSLGLTHFLSDGLKTNTRLLGLLVQIPPLLITLLSPHLFLAALDYGGGIGSALLLALLPIALAWKTAKKRALWILLSLVALDLGIEALTLWNRLI